MDAEMSDNEYRFPDITADDSWADPECLRADARRALPPKREKPTNGADAEPESHGLRLGDGFQAARATSETNGSPRLEVSEISGEVVRLNPEAMEVERMPRHLVFHQCETANIAHRGHSAETSEWGRSRAYSLSAVLWMLGSCLAVSSMVVGAMMMLPRLNRNNAADPRPGEMELIIAEDSRAAAAPINQMLARQRQAEEFHEAWLRASSPDEVSPLIRDPEIVLPLMRRQAWPSPGSTAPAAPRGLRWNALERDERVIGVLEGTLQDHAPFCAYFIETADGLKMDWKATTAHGTADFTTMAEGRGDASEIRGWIKPADFYTLAFPENEFRSYQLLSADQRQFLWVYARLDDPAQRVLDDEFMGGGILQGRAEPQKMTLSLGRGSADALPNQWAVMELLHKEWIAP
jgi:hypothetical protein